MGALDTILTASEASATYPISSRQLRALLARKVIRGRWANGVWLIDHASLKRYLRRRPSPGRPRKKST